jgi:cytoskeletal protein CcmA (bactofilin family)
MLNPSPKAAAPPPEQRRIACFDCAAEFDVPATAQSTMCKKCSTHIDLHDYSIKNAVSKNFKTKGLFVIEPTGYVFNSETRAAKAVIKGRFIGKLQVEGALTLHSTAQIKGSITAASLIIPAASQFRWAGEVKVGTADIEGEFAADLTAESWVRVRSNGRLFGTIKGTSLIAEEGAILVVQARIGARDLWTAPERPALAMANNQAIGPGDPGVRQQFQLPSGS